MNFYLYAFEYSTKSCNNKLNSYSTSCFFSARQRFTRNTHCTKLIQVFKNGNPNRAIH